MAHRSNHTASMNATTATITSSPPPLRPPPHAPSTAADAWGPYSSSRTFSNAATILIILACISLVAFSLHAAVRFLLRRLSRRRSSQPPKPPCDGAVAPGDTEAAAATGTALSAGGWAEEECAICLSELADGERVQVLPACGHGFHTTCVEGWLAARASCPTCRAPSRPSPPGEP